MAPEARSLELYRVIYRSRATLPVDLDLVLSIAGESQPRNSRLGITGILLATRTHFFQALEGPRKAVEKVYARIAADDRHTGLEIISRGPVAQRQFRDWAMKGVGLMGLRDDLARRLEASYGLEGEGLRFPGDEEEAERFLADVRSYLD